MLLRAKLNEKYRKQAYKELMKDLTEELNNIPKKIERLQIAYFRKCIVMLDSYDMEDIKKETLEKIDGLIISQIELKELIDKLEEKYDDLYKVENENKDTKKKKIIKVLKRDLF